MMHYYTAVDIYHPASLIPRTFHFLLSNTVQPCKFLTQTLAEDFVVCKIETDYDKGREASRQPASKIMTSLALVKAQFYRTSVRPSC